MKNKTLVLLVVIAAVLAALVIWKEAGDEPVPIEEAAGFVDLWPENVERSDLTRLVLYSAANPDEKVVLARSEDEPGLWIVENHYDAPVDEDQIQTYLDALTGLKGELREADASEERLAEYSLQADEAFRVEGYVDGDEPAFTLLTGEQVRFDQFFVRMADNQNVYIVDKSPRQEAGVSGDDLAKAPDAVRWVDKVVFDLEKDAITRVAVNTPYKRMVLEKQEAAPEAQEEETTPENADAEESETEDFNWVAVEGDPGFELKASGVDSILRTADLLRAVDVVDPETLAEWGLDNPPLEAEFTLADSDEPIAVVGGRPDPASDGYLMIRHRERPVVYQVSKNLFETLFGMGDAVSLFDFPSIEAEADALTRIDLSQPEGRIVLEKAEGEWNVVEPRADLPLQMNSVNALVDAVGRWRPADYALEVDGGFEDVRTASFSAGDESYTIRVGAPLGVIQGYFAKKGDAEQTFVMTESQFGRIFPDANDLYQRKLFGFQSGDIASIAVERAEDAFVLERTEEGWRFATGAEGAAVSDDTAVSGDDADALASAIAALQAEEILFGAAELGAEPATILRVALEDGSEHTVLFAQPEDEARRAQLQETGLVVRFDTLDAAEVLPASSTLVDQTAAAAEPAEAGEAAAAEPAEDSAQNAFELTAPEIAVNAEETSAEPDAAPEAGAPIEAAPEKTAARPGAPEPEPEAHAPAEDDEADGGDEPPQDAQE